MKSFSIRQHTSLLIHTLLLLGLIVYLLQPFSWDVTLPVEFWMRQILLFALWIALFYFNARILVPRFLLQNKPGLFVLFLFLSICSVMLVSQLVETWIDFPAVMRQAFQMHLHNRSNHHKGGYIDMMLIVTTCLVTGISTSITVVQKWQKDAQLRLQLEKEKINSELSFLRAQINPHFFFNTLNSIYALTQAKGETAGDALYTLSHMMRYVLYQTKNDFVPLTKEISFVEDYLKLMKLRLTDKVDVSFETSGMFEGRSIAPMLFLPFVENAFKHGVSATKASAIRIAISVREDVLLLEVENTIFPVKTELMDESSGIGLANTKRRLDLIYPEQHELTIDERTLDHKFFVKLRIKLS